MKVRILTSAFHDLAAGREFYERQGEGVGEYFSTLYSRKLIRFPFLAAFIEKPMDSTVC